MQRHFKLSALIRFLSNEGISFNLQNTDQDFTISGFSALSETKPGTLTWMKQPSGNWDEIEAAVVICPIHADPPKNKKTLFIKTEHPRLVFSKILDKFATDPFPSQIDETAVISGSAEIADNVYIGPYCVIGDDVKIGSGSVIHSNVTIYPNTTIEENCIIHSGTVLGGDGFGYERDENQKLFKIRHIGGLRIEKNVEIGNNSCIDRGTLSDTIIQENTKISNQCNISHNVVIGKNVMICAKACVNGSTKVEDNVWISPGSIINNGLRIGNNCTVGSGAVVIRDVPPFDVVAGVPARSLKK